MKKIFLLSGWLMVACQWVQAQIPKLLQEVEAKYKKAGSLSAAITQTNEVASLKMTKKSSGVLWLKVPNKFRWQMSSPEPSVLVGNGDKFWYYTPPFDEGDRGQLIIRQASKTHSKLLSILLSGAFSLANSGSIKELNAGRFELIPQKGSAGDVKRAEIVINSKDQVIEKVILEHAGGNRTEVELSKVRLAEKLSNELFVFVAPKGTEIMKE